VSVRYCRSCAAKTEGRPANHFERQQGEVEKDERTWPQRARQPVENYDDEGTPRVQVQRAAPVKDDDPWQSLDESVPRAKRVGSKTRTSARHRAFQIEEEDADEAAAARVQRSLIISLLVGIPILLAAVGGIIVLSIFSNASSDEAGVAQSRGSNSEPRHRPPHESASSSPELVPSVSASPPVSSRSSRPAVVIQERPLRPPKVLPIQDALEFPDDPGKLPFEMDPLLVNTRQAKVYLSDLQEQAWREGPENWNFGKNGELGDGRRIVVNKGEIPKGLSMHPPDTNYTRVCYVLGKQARGLFGAAAFSEDEQLAPKSTRFLIIGDGNILWRADLDAKGQLNEFAIDVSNVAILELRVILHNPPCTGSHAVWVDPFVRTK
jgi:hypothetical protein